MSLSIALLAIATFSGCSQSSIQKKAGPVPNFISSTDEHFVARGKYLAEHVAACTHCHSTPNWEVFAGPIIPGTEGQGGRSWPLADGNMGMVFAGNITPTGVGEWTDGELLQAITSGVHKEGYALFPVMPYQAYGKMTESDAKAIVSYLRTLEPREAQSYPRRLSVFMAKKASSSVAAPSWGVPPGLNDILAKGKYLADIADCVGCHTPEGEEGLNGELLFSGGVEFKMAMGTSVSANITPAEGRGLGYWDEEEFLKKIAVYRTDEALRVEAGPSDPNTVMPWFAYAGMTDDDLKAIWAYLMAQKPNDAEVPEGWRPH